MSETKKFKEELKETFKNIMKKKLLIKVIYGICALIILSIVFQAGMFVGFRKAQFNGAWSEHYERNFGQRSRGFMGSMMGSIPDQFTNGHGTIGKIIKIELPNIIVIDKDKTEKVILTDDDTDIINMGTDIETADLKINDQVVIIGTPNDQGEILAKFIRILPSITAAPSTVNPIKK